MAATVRLVRLAVDLHISACTQNWLGKREYSQLTAWLAHAKESATEIVKCLDEVSSDYILELDEKNIQPASSTKQTLTKAFEDLTLKASELSSALEFYGDSATEVEEKAKFLHA